MKEKLAVIGGGPIGLFTALKLSNQGYTVDLYEKNNWPLDKVCGQGLMPSGLKLLQSLNINLIKGEDYFSFKGIQYFDSNLRVTGKLKRAGAGIERSVLSNKLYEKLKERENVSLLPYHTVTKTSQSEEEVLVTLKNGQERSYSFLFSCDGLHSNTRKNLGLEKHRHGPLRMGARVHFDIAPWSDYVQTYWADKIEAYVTPVSSQRIEVAFLWYQKAIEKGPFLEKRLFDLFPELNAKIDMSKRSNDFKAYGPFSSISNTMNHKRVFFLGDAYKFLDGITGEGLSLGFKSSSVITESFQNFSFKEKAKIKLLYLNYAFFVNLALMLSRNTSLRKLVFTIAQRNSFLFNFVLMLNDLSFINKKAHPSTDEPLVHSKKLS